MSAHTCPTTVPCKACQRLALRRARYTTDPVYREKLREKARARLANSPTERHRTDAARQRNNEAAKQRYQRIKHSDAYKALEKKRRQHTCPDVLPCRACKKLVQRRERRLTDPQYQMRMREQERNRPRKTRPALNRATLYWKMAVGLLAQRDGWLCQICPDDMTWADVSIDHIIPQAQEKNHAPDNLRLAHRACNSRRGSLKYT